MKAGNHLLGVATEAADAVWKIKRENNMKRKRFGNVDDVPSRCERRSERGSEKLYWVRARGPLDTLAPNQKTTQKETR